MKRRLVLSVVVFSAIALYLAAILAKEVLENHVSSSRSWFASVVIGLLGPYGENVKSEGTQTIPYHFGYKGGYRTPGGNKGEGNVTNGLYHFGARYYDPTTGRWTQQDPLGHLGSTTQGNRFLFAGTDPINHGDPNGRLCILASQKRTLTMLPSSFWPRLRACLPSL
jgi:RHS repeat-associated protein